MFEKLSLNKMIGIITTFGFAILLLDIIIEHWEILDKEIMVYIPVLYCTLAIIIGIIAILKWNLKIIRLYKIVLFIAFIVSATGLYFHIVEEDDEDEEAVELTVDQKENEENEKDKPLIAPFAFSGLAVFGLLGTSKKWKSEVWD